ncbi:MAG: cobalamin-dependent protein, partial [Steroidobacteraceae bacterium]|nr:cobalamin-dependent protein [Steroidobacteraceae bacterium]MDW8259013.1 cobalamin-dependent protein [Gammaproteobacteria bacterium]
MPHDGVRPPATAAAEAPLRFVTAASLFDGHDAAINMIRRLLQSQGAEVVHLGHNRSVAEIVRAAIQEDAHAVAVSSYQGGHNEYFAYMVDMLRELNASHIRVIVGGGGTIAPHEIEALERHGVEKIYTPEDGRRLGLIGMIQDVFRRVRAAERPPLTLAPPSVKDHQQLARCISLLEDEAAGRPGRDALRKALARNTRRAPVIGITGTGGAGKSSLNDELLQRFVRCFPDKQIAIVAMDPTRRRSGGALLGDRIRMNSLASPNLFMRSLATRRQHAATSAVLRDVIDLYQLAGFDLIIVETAGIGQSDTEIVDLVDVSLYVMTSEYGAASQLEKIDMLDFADLIVLNKFEKRGALDALRDVRKQWRRNHPERQTVADADVPVYPTIASRFNDPGVNRLFVALCRALERKKPGGATWLTPDVSALEPPADAPLAREPLIPAERVRYLAEIAASGRAVRARIEAQAEAARRAQGLYESLRALDDPLLPAPLERYPATALREQAADASQRALRSAYNAALDALGADAIAALR